MAAMAFLHTCYRITDPDRSVAFYEALGFEKRRELPIRDEAVNYFLGIPGEDGPELELTSTSRPRKAATTSAPDTAHGSAL
jgi:catechol 2,3-dioxygenase-like lactoylglutathione lyase family enzyme